MRTAGRRAITARTIHSPALSGRVLAALAVAAVVGASAAPARADVAEDAGDALVVAGAGSTERLTEGGSATNFSLRLPDDASCPGDSANDNYRVQSYMVPKGIGPGDVEYDGLGPKPNAYGDWATFRQPLYDTATAAFDTAQTADNPEAGHPGKIVNLPSFTFGVYRPGELPAGRYDVGIACTRFNRPVRYWDAELVVVETPADLPAQIRWSVAAGAGGSGASTNTGGSSRSGPVTAGALSAALLAAGVYIRRRRPFRRQLFNVRGGR